MMCQCFLDGDIRVWLAGHEYYALGYYVEIWLLAFMHVAGNNHIWARPAWRLDVSEYCAEFLQLARIGPELDQGGHRILQLVRVL